MAHMLPHQFITVDGVRNFRDFGGYRAQNGALVRRGRLFRSGNYAALTPAGREHFVKTNIKIIVDLRRGQERETSPSQFCDLDVETIYSSLGDGDGVSLAPHLQFIRDGDLSVEGCHTHMLSSYCRIPWEPQHGETFRATFETLAAGRGPLVIHCAAGKDRTGILCGLILHSLGVSADDIMHDYLLTNKVPHDAPWLDGYAQRMSELFKKPVDPQTLVPMLGVHQDYLALAWSEMIRRDGGLDGYLDGLGVNKKMREAVAYHLLEPAPHTNNQC